MRIEFKYQVIMQCLAIVPAVLNLLTGIPNNYMFLCSKCNLCYFQQEHIRRPSTCFRNKREHCNTRILVDSLRQRQSKSIAN